MLMFVVKAHGHQRPQCVIFWSTSIGTLARQSRREEVEHAVVDMSPVVTYLVCPGPGDMPAVRTWVSSTD